MYRIEEAANVVVAVNQYNNKQLADYNLISIVCGYFDKVKEEELNQSDLKFLRYIANVTGIPHYYDLLSKEFKKGFKQNTDIEDIDLKTFSSILYESSLHLSENVKIHKYQQEILTNFKKDEKNRFFLSASTSFGKTHIVYEIIKKMGYQNIVLIFPTVALLSENLEKVKSDPDYAYFNDDFSIHTLSEVKELADKNLFIYTPERFLSYTDKNNTKFDFAFIDEIYKLDNGYIIDEVVAENERDTAYRLATAQVLERTQDILLVGPYIEYEKTTSNIGNDSFAQFLSQNNIASLDYNKYEIVNKSYTEIKSKKKILVDDNLKIDFGDTKGKPERLLKIIAAIVNIDENCIVYCPTRNKTEDIARRIIESNIFINHDNNEYNDLLNHIYTNFTENWVLYKALKHGIGIHHGLIPKYIQKEIINLFNEGKLNLLLSTTTITEGVNTSAKNLIVYQDKKGDKKLKLFDAKNISGRAGRFLKHYSGRVIIHQNKFNEVLESKEDGLRHKNYDKDSQKDEIDLFFTSEEYLNEHNRKEKTEILEKQEEKNLPEQIFSQYKVISRKDKIKIYDNIKGLSSYELTKIQNGIIKIHNSLTLDWESFQLILDVIKPIVKNKNFSWLISCNKEGANFSPFVYLLNFYLKDGFAGSIKYKMEKKNLDIDDAIKETADFVYNKLKYQAVKYLGVFNIMYKYIMAGEKFEKIDEQIGIDGLLVKMEYNALTEIGRIVSDYGVPSNVLAYYEKIDDIQKANKIKSNFDAFEINVFENVQKMVKTT